MELPDLRFSEYFEDRNHEHNIDRGDVIDAIVGRRIHISRAYERDGRLRRKILAKSDSDYLTIVCEEGDGFWWVLSAYPSRNTDARWSRDAGIGEYDDE